MFEDSRSGLPANAGQLFWLISNLRTLMDLVINSGQYDSAC